MYDDCPGIADSSLFLRGTPVALEKDIFIQINLKYADFLLLFCALIDLEGTGHSREENPGSNHFSEASMSIYFHTIQKSAQLVMACKNIVFSLFVLCLMLFGSTPVTAGQTPSEPAPALFTYVSTGKANPSTITQSDQVVETHLIRVNFDVLNESRSRVLRFPLGATEFEAVCTDFEVRSETNFTWRGKFPDDGGDITLTFVDGLCAGTIQSPAGLYEIAPTDQLNVSFLKKIDQSRLPACGGSPVTAHIPGTGFGQTEIGEPLKLVGPNATIPTMDMLVVYTTKARVAAGGVTSIRTIVQNSIDATNTAFINSQINARVRLVHSAEVNYTESSNFSQMLSWLANDPGVATLRNQYSADLVSMLVDNQAYGGIGYLMTDPGPSFEDYAFTVVCWRFATSNNSFPHEVGHNLGCAHDPANSSGQGAYPYSFGHYYAGVYRTVMAYDNYCQCPRYLGFSNPSVNYLNRPTGIANQRDNARTINQTAPIAVNFRGGVASLKPLNVTAPNGGETWTAGSTYNITWVYTSQYPYSDVMIELLRGDLIDRVITFNAPLGSGGTGSYAWTLPSDIAARSDYKIRVSSSVSFNYDDSSDAFFTIGNPNNPTLTLTTPNGGESWNAGTTQTIRWTYTGTPGPAVNLTLLKGGLSQQTIASFISVGSNGSGSYAWAIPSTLTAGTDYTIRITSTESTAIADVSNNSFTIVNGSTPGVATIQVVTPNGGETWKTRTRQAITWSYTGNPGTKVKIELYKGGAFKQVISAGATLGSNGTGTFNWLLPSTLTAGTDYKIKITSTTSTTITDLSDQNFSITR